MKLSLPAASLWSAVVYLFLSFAGATPAGAEPVLEDWNRAEGRPLGRLVSILPDAPRDIDERILAGELDERFESSDRDNPAFGFRAGDYWLRLRVRNSTDRQVLRLLELANPSADRIDVFILDKNRALLKSFSAGDDFPFATGRDVRYRNPTFRLELPPGSERLLYMRVRTTGSMNLYLRLWERDLLLDHRFVEYLIYGLFFGILAAMILYNLFLYLGVRGQYGFLYYVLFISSFLFSRLSTTGMGFQFLWPNIPSLNLYSVSGSIYISSMTFLLFIRKFLVLQEQAPRLSRSIKWLALSGPIAFAAGMVAFFGFDWRGYVFPSNLFALTAVVLAIVCGLLVARSGLRQARFFLFAWSGLIVGISLEALRNLGVIPAFDFIHWAIEIGSAAMILFLSLGLTDIINRMRQELEQYSRTLETRVEKRTNNLRNSLEALKELKQRQDGDYFLISLLMKPLGLSRACGGPVHIETLLDQYKKFHFRKWKSQIGGDLNVSDEISLRDRVYSVFLNADAMGKSMQGAGGYLVLGSVFASILERTRHSPHEKRLHPERWLQLAFQDINRVFESFDGSMMASATLGLIDQTNGAVYMLNAEHPLPVLYRGGRAEFIRCDEALRRLGSTFEARDAAVTYFRLRSGDVIITGSDGRDDLRLPRPGSPLNDDEMLFLKHVEAGHGNLEEIYRNILNTGELTDDISIMRVEFVGQDMPAVEPVAEADELRAGKNRIRELYLQKNYSESLKICQSLGERFPEVDYFVYSASVCLRRLGRFEEAADEAERLILREPGNLDYIKNLARVYTKIDPERGRMFSEQYEQLKNENAAILASP